MDTHDGATSPYYYQLMAFADLLRSLWPAEVFGHSWVAHQSLEKRQVAI